MRKHHGIGVVALAAAVGLAAGAPGALAAEGDDALRDRIVHEIERAKLDREVDVEVAVDGGLATLTGVATTLHAKREVERRAARAADALVSEVRVVPEEPRSEGAIREDVADAILGYVYYGVFDSVEVGVSPEGAVLLQGSVQLPRRRSDIEHRVAKVPGVVAIQNEIAVQSVSAFDDRLRRELVRAIYGAPIFERYANRVNPPIRILVDRGRVTLTGVVGSEVERVALEHLARGTLSFSVENRVEVEGQRRPEPGSNRS